MEPLLCEHVCGRIGKDVCCAAGPFTQHNWNLAGQGLGNVVYGIVAAFQQHQNN